MRRTDPDHETKWNQALSLCQFGQLGPVDGITLDRGLLDKFLSKKSRVAIKTIVNETKWPRLDFVPTYILLPFDSSMFSSISCILARGLNWRRYLIKCHKSWNLTYELNWGANKVQTCRYSKTCQIKFHTIHLIFVAGNRNVCLMHGIIL
jgi:hypothetical protein